MDFIEPNVNDKHEEELNDYYSVVENKLSQLWSKTSENEQVKELKTNLMNQLNKTKELNDKLHIKEQLTKIENEISSIGSQVNSGLDLLDSKLEIAEKEAGKYMSSFTSFLSSIISVKEEPAKTEDPKKDYPNTRYGADLLKLHTDESLYTDKDPSFKVPEDSSQLLSEYPNLQKLMNELVPGKIDSQTFWFNYYKNDSKFKEEEKNRKELLEADNEEEFSWDNEDDEAIVN